MSDPNHPLKFIPEDKIPSKLRAFQHGALYFIRLLDKVDSHAAAVSKRVVMITGNCIVLCDTQGILKRVIPVAKIQEGFIQTVVQGNNRTLKFGWVRVQDEHDLVLRQEEFQVLPANGAIEEFLQTLADLKLHVYNIPFPIIEQVDGNVVSMANLQKPAHWNPPHGRFSSTWTPHKTDCTPARPTPPYEQDYYDQLRMRRAYEDAAARPVTRTPSKPFEADLSLTQRTTTGTSAESSSGDALSIASHVKSVKSTITLRNAELTPSTTQPSPAPPLVPVAPPIQPVVPDAPPATTTPFTGPSASPSTHHHLQRGGSFTDSIADDASSTGPWGGRGHPRGNKLFEEMGKVYLARQIENMWEGRASFPDRASPPKSSQYRTSRSEHHSDPFHGEFRVDPLQDHRSDQRSSPLSPASLLRDPVSTEFRDHHHTSSPRDTSQGPHPESLHETLAYLDSITPTKPPGPPSGHSGHSERDTPSAPNRTPSAPNRSSEVPNRTSEVPSGDDESHVSVDIAAYNTMSPTAKTPRTRGAEIPPHGRAPRNAKEEHSRLLREEFWRHYMHEYDRICGRASPRRHPRASSPAPSPLTSTRVSTPRRSSAHPSRATQPREQYVVPARR